MRGVLFIVLAALMLVFSGAQSQEAQKTAKIGVLAYRGVEHLDRNWAAVAQYLSNSVPGWKFELVPVTLVSAEEQIESGSIEFLTTNPGHFVDLDTRHALSVIASRLKRLSDGSLSTHFGGAIVARADFEPKGLHGAVGGRVLAVDKDAFGGFQIAWREFDRVGIDLFSDTESLEFTGFPMDRIVTRLLAGEAEIGLIRSGLMEAMIAEGKVEKEALVVLNRTASFQHPEALSTRLYPEWPFIALASTPAQLRDAVALALLSAQTSPTAVQAGMRDMWAAPVSYDAVQELVTIYTAKSTQPGKISFLGLIPLLISTALGLALLVTIAFWVRRRSQASGKMISATVDADNPITPREKEVLDLIAAGRSSKEIARELGISPKTVEFHRANLLKKYGARTSSQLVAKAT
ncbi:MAG: PhnD/SsuA/transferrin family substrate-binding protein [Rhodobacteraceae bacterium]|nr:PhnD/SsuA/transferrin family substrate-binding protein [Paracoccaceae bacterium]